MDSLLADSSFAIAFAAAVVLLRGVSANLHQSFSASAISGGLNPKLDVFTAWIAFYGLYAIAYAWALCKDVHLPAPLSFAWVTHAVWLVLATRSAWASALSALFANGFLLLVALPALTHSEASGALQVAGVASAGLIVWLLGLALVNHQLAYPAQARRVTGAAGPIVASASISLSVITTQTSCCQPLAWTGLRVSFTLAVGIWIVNCFMGNLRGKHSVEGASVHSDLKTS